MFQSCKLLALSIMATVVLPAAARADEPNAGYFPSPESAGGWQKLDDADDIRATGGMDSAKGRFIGPADRHPLQPYKHQIVRSFRLFHLDDFPLSRGNQLSCFH